MPIAENGRIRLHYEISGCKDGAPLVLMNSLGSDLRMWDKVVAVFEKRWRVLRYDVRGHGESSVPTPPYTIEQLGIDLLFLLDACGIERACFCGLSLGGLTAIWMGMFAPHRVDRMVLANTAARIGTVAGWDERVTAVRSADMAQLAEATLGRWFTPAYRERHPGEMETIRAMISRTHPQGYSGCCEALRDTDLRNGLCAIEAPCLVIAGTHDPATPPEDGRGLHAELRGSRYVELDASHLSAWERAEEFAREAGSFLAGEERGDG
jgi:3-oxoadipate enol-lactonase